MKHACKLHGTHTHTHTHILQSATRELAQMGHILHHDTALQELHPGKGQLDVTVRMSAKYHSIFPFYILPTQSHQLKTLNLARNLMRAIDAAAELPPLERFPKAHMVAYRYYVGLYHFWNEQYDVAEGHLMFAFQHCHRDARKNKA